MCTPDTSEDAAPRRDVPAGVGPWADERFLADDRARFDGGVDADLHVVAHDDAEFSQARVDLRAAPDHPDRGFVESEVRDLRARTEVASLSEDAVAHIVLMGHVGGRHEDRVLHLAAVPHLGLWPDRRGRPHVAVRADLRAGPDNRRPLDVRSAPHPRAFLDEDLAHEGRPFLHVAMGAALQRGQQGRIRAQEIPRSADIDPFAGEPKSVDVPGGEQRADRVRNLVLATGREHGLVDEREDVLVEDVDPCVDEPRLRIPRLLLETNDPAVVQFDDAEGTRILHLRETHHGTANLAVVSDHGLQRVSRHDDVAVHAEECAVHVAAHAPDRMGRATPFRLLLVRDREPEGIAVSEALPNAMALPADEDRDTGDPRGPDRLERVSEERLSRHREKGLWEVGREGAHPRALTGREDHCLHAAAPFALDRTVEYISFALGSSRDSASTRIFGSVPENRTRAQPSSNWRRHPSGVVTSAPRPRNARSNVRSIDARFDAS